MVKLECEARGVPIPTITWYRKGDAIFSSRRAQYVEQGHYLKIPRAQASDAGQYTCKVTNVAGSTEKRYELDVYGNRFYLTHVPFFIALFVIYFILFLPLRSVIERKLSIL